MPFSQSQLHAAQPLVDLCVAYDPSEEDYIRNVFFPRKNVQHLTDNIRSIAKGDILRLYDLDASGDGEVAEVQYRLAANLTYNCNILAAKARISQIDVKNADAALLHEMRQTKQALTSIGVRMEHLAVKGTLRSTTVMTNNDSRATGARWDDFSSSNSQPIEDLKAMVAQVRRKTGKGRKGRIVVAMDQIVWDLALSQHPNVLNRITFNPGGTGAVLTPAILAAMIGIRETDLVLTNAQFTDNKQGETDVFHSFMGDDCVVAMVDDGGLDDQALGHEFVFDGLAGEDPFLVRKWREEGKGAIGLDYVGVACAADYKVTNADAGFLLQTVVDKTASKYNGLLG